MNLFRLSQLILIITICVSLTACMTPQQRYNRDYSVAKQNFVQQNYRTAFIRVQTPAKAGIPDAQYALGYMYYYGKGTVQNPTMARYWFQQAAQKGQPDAQQALQTMPPASSQQSNGY